jgi:predicted nucleic acid-binding protein
VPTEIRFWDTSALLQVFDQDEADHRAAVGLWDTRRGRFVRRTSMIVGVEALQAARAKAPAHLPKILAAIESDSDLVPFDSERFDVALEIGKHHAARGADTAIVASAVYAQRRTSASLMFITADEEQAKLAVDSGLKVKKLRPTPR